MPVGGGYFTCHHHIEPTPGAPSTNVLIYEYTQDNPRYYSDSFSKTSRLGLAPITLLLNPVRLSFITFMSHIFRISWPSLPQLRPRGAKQNSPSFAIRKRGSRAGT